MPNLAAGCSMSGTASSGCASRYHAGDYMFHMGFTKLYMFEQVFVSMYGFRIGTA